ncbi:MAG: helix-turn-helix domain-containing protein [Novosphingobium sp.]|nr:helix-turn-helix domain-containing protein [Novosphingobium sp.]
MAEADAIAAELPLNGVGTRLRCARERAGLSRAQLAARTKIPERHLQLIEDDDFAALPARAYAIGFARNYARAVGVDEQQVARDVRAELDGAPGEDPRAPAFAPGDPGRVPSARFAWLAALAALLALIAGFTFWRSYYMPAVSLPPLDAPIPRAAVRLSMPPTVPAAAAPAAPAAPALAMPASASPSPAAAPSPATAASPTAHHPRHDVTATPTSTPSAAKPAPPPPSAAPAESSAAPSPAAT